MAKEFRQTVWDELLEADVREIVRLGIREDLGEWGDWTTRALVPDDVSGGAVIVVRKDGVVAGLAAVPIVLGQIDGRLRWQSMAQDGEPVRAGREVGRIEGPASGILQAERLALNLLGRLSGIATLTRRYVDAVAGTKARIYDTRKTTPGWRRLEKYAVKCGGAWNHRTGLFEAVLIKDNHLALGAESASRRGARYSPGEAVAEVRRFLHRTASRSDWERMIVEIEVDTLDQLEEVLPGRPDIVLLDNMTAGQLRAAVSRRDALAPEVELEASGGVNLESVRAVAESGVDRISVGALTHSAVSLDFGLDWVRG